MPAVAQRPRNLCQLTLADGFTVDFPNFTCTHCQRAVSMDPELTPQAEAELTDAARQRGFQGDVIALLKSQFEESRVCRGCDALTCVQPGCVEDCRNVYNVDGPLATENVLWQPWLGRDKDNYPVDRIYHPDGTAELVRRKDNGMSERELARTVIPRTEFDRIAEAREQERIEREHRAWHEQKIRIPR